MSREKTCMTWRYGCMVQNHWHSLTPKNDGFVMLVSKHGEFRGWHCTLSLSHSQRQHMAVARLRWRKWCFKEADDHWCLDQHYSLLATYNLSMYLSTYLSTYLCETSMSIHPSMADWPMSWWLTLRALLCNSRVSLLARLVLNTIPETCPGDSPRNGPSTSWWLTYPYG